MSWTQVTINASSVAALSAAGLMNRFSKRRREAGAPQDAAVWHRTTTDGGHVFYFSPSASVLAGNLFAEFEASTVLATPDLLNFNQVAL